MAADELETPSATDGDIGARGVAARFRGAYTGPLDPADALFWLAHPADTAPSGAPAPVVALRDLRAMLYQPDADPDVRVRYATLERTLLAERDAARAALAAAVRAAPAPVADEAPGRPVAAPRGRPLVLLGATVLVLGAVGAAAAVALPRAVAPAVPTVTARALQVDAGSGIRLEPLVRQAFREPPTSASESAGTELDALIEQRLGPASGSGVTVVGGASIDGSPEEQPSTAPLVAPTHAPSGGTLDVVLILLRPSDWRWTVYAVPASGGAPQAVATVLGHASAGLLQTARIPLPAGMVPSGLRLSTTTGTPFYWETYQRHRKIAPPA